MIQLVLLMIQLVPVFIIRQEIVFAFLISNEIEETDLELALHDKYSLLNSVLLTYY